MKLAVITATCRSNPRFAEMARTLFAAFRRAPADAALQWIIVDERLWWEDGETRLADVLDALAAIPREVASRIEIDHFAPPPTRHRGPDISDPRPAHNTARNAGLEALAPDAGYVMFLADCTVVTADWVAVALELAGHGLGWKCTHKALHDHVIPKDEPFRYQNAWDSFHPVVAATVAGPCWGVPREPLTACVGFDPDYDGEDDLYDHEMLLRLARVGVSFVTTKRAGVVRMDRTRLKTEVTTRRETLRATRNQAYYQDLLRDRDRVLPGAAAAAGSAAQLGGGPAHRSARPVPPRAAAGLAALPAPGRPAYTAGRVVTPPPAPRAPSKVSPDPRDGDDAGEPADGTAAGAMTPDERQALAAGMSPGARAMFLRQEPPMTETPKPMSLQERARAQRQAKLDRSAAEAAGTAPPLEEGARCAYIPTQGGHKGQRCRLKKAHGGAHAYDEPSAYLAPASPAAPAKAPAKPAPVRATVSAEPPAPPPTVAAVRATIDAHIEAIATALEARPNTLARQVVMLAVALRREGVLADAATFDSMLMQAVDGNPALTLDARVALVEATMPEVVELCGTLPPIPATEHEFKLLAAYTRVLDSWRRAAGLPSRLTMMPYDRGYAAANDLGLHIVPPDDVRSLDDELANLERAIAATEGEDDLVSVEPLSDAQVAAQAAALEADEPAPTPGAN